MSLIDKALGAITPPESEDARAEATRKARAASDGNDWLALALDHHDQIRAAFETCRTATGSGPRTLAMKALAHILNGHAYAEEVVLYPAMAKAGEKGHAGMAYGEQTTAKMQMAELERIDAASDAWADKLEHIRGAVLHHIYEEEKIWFPELKRDYDDQIFLTQRFREEFARLQPAEKVAGERRTFEADTEIYQKPLG
jgi:hemerythrin superfamily protein